LNYIYHEILRLYISRVPGRQGSQPKREVRVRGLQGRAKVIPVAVIILIGLAVLVTKAEAVMIERSADIAKTVSATSQEKPGPQQVFIGLAGCG